MGVELIDDELSWETARALARIGTGPAEPALIDCLRAPRLDVVRRSMQCCAPTWPTSTTPTFETSSHPIWALEPGHAKMSFAMTITITAFERSPDGGKGLARDTRVRWALEEVGQP